MNLFGIEKIFENEPRYRLRQVYSEIFGRFIESFESASAIPKSLREVLQKNVSIDIDAKLFRSKDGKTVKALLLLSDGNSVECVLMRHSSARNTVCVSSQVGCPMGCDFCATGKMGFLRNLSHWEILEQVLLFARLLKNDGEKITNIVFMGMGEPFLNYDNVMRAIKFLNGGDTFCIGARKISVSTCGIISGIEKFMNEPLQLNLAVSLHAPSSDVRNEIMPVNKTCPLPDLLSAVRRYLDKTGRKVMVEYLLLAGVNDSVSDAKMLADILKEFLGKLFMVNLILYNETCGKYKGPSLSCVNAFRSTLEKEGISVTQRFRMGHEIEGACGQLATEAATEARA